MKPSLSILPKEFRSQKLFQLIGPLLDSITCEVKSKTLLIRNDGLVDLLPDEYIINISKVYIGNLIFDTSLYTIDLDNKKIRWSVDPDTDYYIDFTYYTTCDSEIKYSVNEPVLDSIIPNKTDMDSVLAYYIKMVKTSLGTLYCVENLIKILNLNATITEWFETVYLKPFKFNIRFESNPDYETIKGFIDYVFIIKNERTHLAIIGTNECENSFPWDFFTFDKNTWDDANGVKYRGTNVCIKHRIQDTLQVKKPKFYLTHRTYDKLSGSFNWKTENYWNGIWDDRYWESKFIPTFKLSHTRSYITQNSDEFNLYSDYTDFNLTKFYPDDTLFPDPILYPNKTIITGELLYRSTETEHLFGYQTNQKLLVKGIAGVKTLDREFSKANVGCIIYPINIFDIVLKVLSLDDDMVSYHIVSVIPNQWNYVSKQVNLPKSRYSVSVQTYLYGDYSMDNTVYEFHLDSVHIKSL